MWCKSIRALVISLFVGIFISCSVYTAEAAELKIGVMNVQKVLVQSEPGQKAKAAFEKKRAEYQAEFAKEEKKFKAMQDEIVKKSSVWPKEKKDEKTLELSKMQRDLQTKAQDASLEMKQLQDRELEPIIKELEKVVDAFGAREGYALILDSKNGVVYHDKAQDISDALITELNKAMK